MLEPRDYTARLKKPPELIHPRAITVGDDRHGYGLGADLDLA